MISTLVSATCRDTQRTVSGASSVRDRVAYGNVVELLVLRHGKQVLRRQVRRRPQRWDRAGRLWLTALSRLVKCGRGRQSFRSSRHFLRGTSSTSRHLGFSKQVFYAWKHNPVSRRDWDDAHLINTALDIRHDDPAFG